jgi:hypothetical protein
VPDPAGQVFEFFPVHGIPDPALGKRDKFLQLPVMFILMIHDN